MQVISPIGWGLGGGDASEYLILEEEPRRPSSRSNTISSRFSNGGRLPIHHKLNGSCQKPDEYKPNDVQKIQIDKIMKDFLQKSEDTGSDEEEKLQTYQNLEDYTFNNENDVKFPENEKDLYAFSCALRNPVHKGSIRAHFSNSVKNDGINTEQTQVKDHALAHPRVHMSLREKLMESRAVLHWKLDCPVINTQAGMHFSEERDNSPDSFAYGYRGKQKLRKLSLLGPDAIANDISHGSVDDGINNFSHSLAKNALNIFGHRLFENGLTENSSRLSENDVRLEEIGTSPGSVESSVSHRSAEQGIRLSEIDIHHKLVDNGNNLRFLKHKLLHDSSNVSRNAGCGKVMKKVISAKGPHELHPVPPVKDEGDVLNCDESLLLETDLLKCDETLPLESFQSLENISLEGELERNSDSHMGNELNPIGNRIATAGWYICDQGTILLAHEDGGCSFYDAVNMEGKAEYKCPVGAAPIPWDDCWLIKAVGSDGYTNKYIVAATSGSALDSGFCSWDFETRSVTAYYNDSENQINDAFQTKWYKPCGPLIASAGTFFKTLTLHDIRDGDIITTWSTKSHISSLDFSSPLQWTKKDKIVVAENHALSVWDVNTMDGQCLYIEMPEEKQICAFHIHDANDDCGAGIRRRLNSSETEGYDGIFCTKKDINVLDFRVPGGVGLCFSSLGEDLQSVFAKGDTILTGGVNPIYNECGMQQWSARKGRLICTYAFHPSPSHYAQLSLAQVWGSYNAVMAINGNGLHIFKGFRESVQSQHCVIEEVKDILGTQDLFNPSFDYAHSRVLLISRDRPANWCYWPNQ